MKTLHSFILTASVAVSLIFFGGSYLVFTYAFRDGIRDSAREQAAVLARSTWHSMTQLMFQGWSRDELLGFIDATQTALVDSPTTIAIHRGEAVAERYGHFDQPAPDTPLTRALTDGAATDLLEGDFVRHVFPLVAEARCLSCHDNARVGDVLGAIDVRQDTRPALAKAEKRFFFSLLALAPLPFVVAFLVVWRINRRIDDAVGRLRDNVDNLNRVSDLTSLRPTEASIGFRELDDIFEQIAQLGTRLRNVAVDKDLLEFEIRLMEKFIITSEVVKDWHEYVKELLIEISKVIDAYTLFCVFKVEDELFSLEIFWRHRPSPDQIAQMEERVGVILEANPYLRGIHGIQINHTVAEPDRDMPPLNARDMELQTKSLLVEAPKIGGIVGIGVQSEMVRDDTRALVMESILSTLLNVIGSVRAIYKYTRDLEYYATRDPLTHLYNQRVFWELLEYEISRASRHKQSFGLLMIDLDNFKSINDTYGHHVGDRFLQEFANVVRHALRNEDILARYGGDEFVALLPEVSEADAYTVAGRVVEAAANLAVELPDGGRAKASVSVGLAIYPDHGDDKKDLFLLADNMMYKAKNEGKNRVALPSDVDVAEAYRKIGEKSQIVLRALDEGLVRPYFQPIMHGGTRQLAAVEVLSRIQTDEALFEAGEFIELAEKMGVIHKLDFQVMDQAMAEVARTGYAGYLFINLSPRAMVLSEFLPEVKAMVIRHGVTPDRIVFEITERETIKNISLLTKFVAALKMEGFLLAVDDFGSGFSSYHYIKHFPIDFLKIEGEFVLNMVKSERDAAFVRSIATLARELGIRTVAEFVESEEVLEQARAAGIDYMQGWHIGRPGPNILAG
jgi:diguanylate cyclase (GGDEF)-like protein